MDFLRNYPRLNIGPSKGDKRFYFETQNGVSVVVCDLYDGKNWIRENNQRRPGVFQETINVKCYEL